jgi:hypothetical protein
MVKPRKKKFGSSQRTALVLSKTSFNSSKFVALLRFEDEQVDGPLKNFFSTPL